MSSHRSAVGAEGARMNRCTRGTGTALFLAALTTAIGGRAGEPDRVANFFNVIAPDGADPWVFRHVDGWYYALVTTGSNITLLRSRTISAPGAGERKVVYVPRSGMKNLWAPELHWIDKAWYVYFAADNGNNANHRMFVLENGSDDPWKGTYVLKGKLSIRSADRWAIDGTVLRIKDRTYFVWSGWEGATDEAQNLYIAPMTNPWTLAVERVLISRPTLPWEERGGPPAVNEGPQALARGESLFLVYAAAGSWTDHCAFGLLQLLARGRPAVAGLVDEITDARVRQREWRVRARPLFVHEVTGWPGGLDHLPRRQASRGRVVAASPRQRFDWNADGSPEFGVPCAPDRPLALPGGEPARIRIEAETAALTGAARVAADPKASGGAKVGYIDTRESSMTLRVNMPVAGTYTLVVRSCNGSSGNAVATHSLSVNGGEPCRLRYANAGRDAWSNIFLNVELDAGLNSLRFSRRENSAEIDCVDLIPLPST